MRSPVTLWTVLVLLLSLATILLHRPEVRYVPVEGAEPVDVMPEPASLAKPPWQVRGTPEEVLVEQGKLVLDNRTNGHSPFVRRFFNDRRGITAIRLDARLSTDDVQSLGGRGVPGAGLYVASTMPDGKFRFIQPPDLFRLLGTQKDVVAQSIFPLLPEAVGFLFAAHMINATGHLKIEALSMTPMHERALFSEARALLIALWALLFLGAAVLFVRYSQSWRWALVALAASGAGAFLLLLSGSTRRMILAVPMAYIPALGDIEAAGDDGHFVIFILIGLLARLAIRDVKLRHLTPPLLALAVAGEVVQYLAIERSVQVGDALRNIAGTLSGIVLAIVIARLASLLSGRPALLAERQPVAE